MSKESKILGKESVDILRATKESNDIICIYNQQQPMNMLHELQSECTENGGEIPLMFHDAGWSRSNLHYFGLSELSFICQE